MQIPRGERRADGGNRLRRLPGKGSLRCGGASGGRGKAGGIPGDSGQVSPGNQRSEQPRKYGASEPSDCRAV